MMNLVQEIRNILFRVRITKLRDLLNKIQIYFFFIFFFGKEIQIYLFGL